MNRAASSRLYDGILQNSPICHPSERYIPRRMTSRCASWLSGKASSRLRRPTRLSRGSNTETKAPTTAPTRRAQVRGSRPTAATRERRAEYSALCRKVGPCRRPCSVSCAKTPVYGKHGLEHIGSTPKPQRAAEAALWVTLEPGKLTCFPSKPRSSEPLCARTEPRSAVSEQHRGAHAQRAGPTRTHSGCHPRSAKAPCLRDQVRRTGPCCASRSGTLH